MSSKPPRNGVGLGDEARRNVAELTASLARQLREAATTLERIRYLRGSREWRRACWTVAQRAEVKAATVKLRTQARAWVKR